MSCDGPLGVPLPGDEHPVLSLVPQSPDHGSGPDGGRSSESPGPASGPGPVASGPEDQDRRTGPEASSELVLTDALAGRDMTPAERLWAFLKVAGKRAIAKWRNRKGALHRYARTAPETIATYRAYIGSEDSRKWIPEGYEEYRLIRFLRGTQVVYHKTAGPAGVVFGDAVAKTFARGRRLAMVLACLTLAVILIAVFA